MKVDSWSVKLSSGETMGKVRTSPNSAKPTAYCDLNDKDFEEFCCALLNEFSEINQADLYKAPRQPQYGVDVKGELKSGGLYVISCKVRQTLKKGDLKKFSDEFFDHWETHWKEKRVKQFTLAVTYQTNSQQREQEIATEKDRFLKIGIKYDVWPPRVLDAKAREHKGIATQFLGQEHAERLCGRDQPAAALMPNNQGVIDAAVARQLADLQKIVSEQTTHELEKARDLFRKQEKEEEIDKILNGIVNEPGKWSALDNKTKSAVKRLQSSIALHREDLTVAKQLCSEAKFLDEGNVKVLETLIILVEQGTEAALEVLEAAETNEELKLRASLNLNILNTSQALSDLQKVPASAEDGEVLRLYAIAYLMQGDRDKAVFYMRNAEEAFGDWSAVQKTAIMIRLHMSYSPCLPFYPTSWPDPIIPEMLLEDKETIQNLENGLLATEALLSKVAPETEEHQNLQVWRLAFLSNLGKYDEALEFAQSLLQKTPALAGAIIWSLARGYEFDVSLSIEEIKKLLEVEKADSEQILSLVGLYQMQRNFTEADRILEQTKERFDTPELQGLWKKWYSKGKPDAFELSEGNLNEDERLLRIVYTAIQKNEWHDLETYLDSIEHEKITAHHIFIACLNFAIHSQWKFIEQFRSVLLEQVRTPESVRLAAFSAFHNRRFKDVVGIIDQYAHIFLNGVLSANMRRLRSQASFQEGEVFSAIKETKKLVQEEGKVEDRLNLIKSLLDIGDTEDVLYYIRSLPKEGLSSEVALKLSGNIAHLDQSLAKELFKQVNVTELPEGLLTSHMEYAYKFGMDPHKEVFDRISSTSSSVMRAMSLEDIKEYFKVQNERHKKIDHEYAQGNLPIHFSYLASGTDMVVSIFSNFSSQISDQPTHKDNLFCRFGGRAFERIGKLEEVSLYLDITSLIILFKLGVLEPIAKVVCSIHISRHALVALQQAESSLLHPQPARLEAMKEVISYVDGKRIRGAIPKDMGWTNELGELITIPTVVYHDNRASDGRLHAINIKKIILCLQELGGISSDDVEELNSKLPAYMAAEPQGHDLSRGEKIIFSENTIELLSILPNLLKTCLRYFDVYADHNFIEQVRSEVCKENANKIVRNEISELRKVLSKKVLDGCYLYFKASDMINREGEQEARNSWEQCLMEIVSLKKIDNAFFCVDDRCIGRHTSINDNLVLDTYGILHILYDHELIDRNAFYTLIHKLRSANYFYIPVTVEEIKYWLNKSSLAQDADLETPELQEIRRYVSKVALNEKGLVLNANGMGAFDEKKFIFSILMLSNKTLLSIWQNKEFSVQAKERYSEWVWDALRLDRLNRVPLQQTEEEGYQHLRSVILCGFLLNAVQLNAVQQSKQYLSWLNTYIFEEIINFDFDLAKKAAQQLARTLVSVCKPEVDSEVTSSDEKLLLAYVGEVIQCFPQELQDVMLKNNELSALLGLMMTSVLTVDGSKFIARDYWRGIGKAIECGSSCIKTFGDNTPISVELISYEDANPIFLVNSQEKISDPIFSFLSNKKDDISNAFEKNREWFPSSYKHYKKVRDQIIKTKDLAKRANIILKEQESSPICQYSSLETHIRLKSSFEWPDLTQINFTRLLHHLGLAGSSTTLDNLKLANAARKLLSEQGIEIAFIRYAALPIRMPDVILQKLSDMPTVELLELIEKLYQKQRFSIIGLFHLLNVVCQMCEKREQFSQFKLIIDFLQKQGRELCDAYVVVLQYFETAFSDRNDWLRLSVEQRVLLCWYHSNQIFSLLHEYGMSYDTMIDLFKKRSRLSLRYALLKDRDYRICPYAPSNLNKEYLLLAGLCFALGENGVDFLLSSERKKITALFSHKEDGGKHTSPWLLKRNEVYDNLIDSFLITDLYRFSYKLGGEEFAKWFAKEEVGGAIEKVEEALNATPNASDEWLKLFIFYNPGNLPVEKINILDIGCQVDFFSLFANKDPLAYVVLRYTAESINLTGNTRLINAFRNNLLELVKKLSNQYSRPIFLSDEESQDWEVRAAFYLLDALLILERCDDIKSSAQNFGSVVIEACLCWPSLIPLCRSVVNKYIKELDFLNARPLWRTYISLRSL